MTNVSPSYDDLLIFVKHVADEDEDRSILAAEARKLLGITQLFDPKMVLDRIRDANFAENESGMENHLRDHLEALCIEYGDAPIDYIVDRIEKEGLPKDWNNVVLSELGAMNHPPTVHRRREILEKVMLESQSPRTQYVALMGLAYVYNHNSIKSLETLINGNSVESLKADAKQLLDGLQKSLKAVETYAGKEHHRIIDQAIDIALNQIKGE